jgi:hypothetical protein
MATWTEQRLGHGFGLLGGLLIGIAGLLSLVASAVFLVLGRPFGALGYGAEGVLLLVIGGLAALFAHLGYRSWRGHPLSGGVLLIVTAVLAWAVVGLGPNVLAILGALFVFLGGVLYLLGPLDKGISNALPA